MTTINRLDPTARQMLAIFQNNSAPICGETQKAIEVANTEECN